MDTIRTKVRNLIEDGSQNVTDIFTYTNSAVFTLSESNPIVITEVYVNDVDTGVTHTYNSITKKVTISSSLTSGDTVQIDYTSYLNYSNSELTNFIQNALVYLSTSNYYDFEYDTTDDAIYPPTTTREENLIALVTAILIKPENINIRLPNLSITAADKMSTKDRISKVLLSFKKDTTGIFDLI
jgi:hypothetical protein